jgi:molybdopterin molybdotransferase
LEGAALISLHEAQTQLLALAHAKPSTALPLAKCYGRYLAQDIVAKRHQPASDLSAMDGYAIRWADMPGPWTHIGESAAGRGFSRDVGLGQAVRIFTGARVPNGADTILVQEDAEVIGDVIRLNGEGPPRKAAHVRLKSNDFAAGDTLLRAGERLNAGKIALAAMAGYEELAVTQRPKITYFSTGDELVPAGAETKLDQLPSSNNLMIAGLLAHSSCEFDDAGIVPDSLESIIAAFQSAASLGADVIVTSGGVSVGDHDLIQPALRAAGANIEFWKIAMKPGKPVLVARLGKSIVLGLPGNPSSTYVTAFLLLLPLVAHLNGAINAIPDSFTAKLSDVLPATGVRTEFVRAVYNGQTIQPFFKQDSGLVSILAKANALIIRPPNTLSTTVGEWVEAYRLDA